MKCRFPYITTQEQDSDIPQHEQLSLQWVVVGLGFRMKDTLDVVVLGGILSLWHSVWGI
jgi:hypothetical protein